MTRSWLFLPLCLAGGILAAALVLGLTGFAAVISLDLPPIPARTAP